MRLQFRYWNDKENSIKCLRKGTISHFPAEEDFVGGSETNFEAGFDKKSLDVWKWIG